MRIYTRGKILWLDFYVEGERRQKSLRMEDTPQNRKKTTKEIIPQLQAKIALGQYRQKKKEPKKFDYYFKIFIEEKEQTRSYKNKSYMFNKAIKFFQNTNVKDITRLEIKNKLRQVNGNSETKRDYLTVFRDVLDLAVDDQEIEVNPTIGIKLPKQQTNNKINYFSKDAVQKLLYDKEDPELNLYLQIAFSTGMRAEEILALKYSDIQGSFVKIQRTKTRDNGLSNYTKTDGSRRTIPFNVELSNNKDKSFFIFPNIDHVEKLRNRWKKILKRNNIRHRGISNCRHTFATHILKDNIVSISELSGLLGHSKVSTTLTFYASVIDSHDTTVKEKLKSFCYNTVIVNESK